MPFAIDEKAMRRQFSWNSSRPQEVVKFGEEIPEGWMGTPGHGLPVKEIPHLEFPCVVYLHPNEPTRTVVHRNDKHEVVHEEEIPLEHLTKVICCDAHRGGGPKDCAACNQLLKGALAGGWVKEPYVPKPAVDESAALYGPQKEIGDSLANASRKRKEK
jgi:hypothetical protein